MSANICTVCGSTNFNSTTLPTYQLREYPQITLVDSVLRENCTNCGDVLISVYWLPALLSTAAYTLVSCATRLSGVDVKLLRDALDILDVDFAKLLGVQAADLDGLTFKEVAIAEVAPIRKPLLDILADGKGVNLVELNKALAKVTTAAKPTVTVKQVVAPTPTPTPTPQPVQAPVATSRYAKAAPVAPAVVVQPVIAPVVVPVVEPPTVINISNFPLMFKLVSEEFWTLATAN